MPLLVIDGREVPVDHLIEQVMAFADARDTLETLAGSVKSNAGDTGGDVNNNASGNASSGGNEARNANGESSGGASSYNDNFDTLEAGPLSTGNLGSVSGLLEEFQGALDDDSISNPQRLMT